MPQPSTALSITYTQIRINYISTEIENRVCGLPLEWTCTRGFSEKKNLAAELFIVRKLKRKQSPYQKSEMVELGRKSLTRGS